MEYRENSLNYEDYCALRKSVDWLLFADVQMQRAVDNSLYTITAVEDDRTVVWGV